MRLLESVLGEAAAAPLQANLPAWFPNVEGYQTADQFVQTEIARLVLLVPPHDPYQVEDLLSRASDLLDRCLIYRREIYDLEIAATGSVLEYYLFSQLSRCYRDLEKATPKAATVTAAARNSLIDEKWDRLEEHQTRLQRLHERPGSSLNYDDRRGRLWKFFTQDFADAYQRLRAAEKGIEQIFPIPPDAVRPLDEQMTLDSIVLWAREVTRQIELNTAEEVEFERIFWLCKGNFYSKERFDERRYAAKPEFSITITTDHFLMPTISDRLRVKGIGISFANGVDQKDYQRFGITAIVFPPNMPELFIPARGFGPRLPIVLTNVVETNPTTRSPVVLGARSINNINPLGEWRIRLSRSTTSSYVPARPITETHVEDLALHIVVRGGVAKDASDWDGFQSW